MRKITSIIKLLIMGLWTLICAFISFFAIILRFHTKGALWVAHKIWTPGIMLILGAKMIVKGLDEIDKNKTYIILANHTSNLDIPMLTSGLPLLFYYVTKKEFQKIPIIGWVMTAAGVIFIDRGNKEKAIRSMRIAGKKIKQGKNVMIFPEGTFDHTKPMLPFKKGAFHLAMHAEVEILPVAIVDACNVWPADDNLGLKSGTVELRIGEPISTLGMTKIDIEKVLEQTRDSIQELINQ